MTAPIAAIYDRVCKAKPEAAVPGLLHERFFWTHPSIQSNADNNAAEPLIVHHWLGMLPLGCGLGRDAEDSDWWMVISWEAQRRFTCQPSPFLALAEYLAPGSTGEQQ